MIFVLCCNTDWLTVNKHGTMTDSDTVHSVSHVRTIVGYILGHGSKILMLFSHGETTWVPTRVP